MVSILWFQLYFDVDDLPFKLRFDVDIVALLGYFSLTLGDSFSFWSHCQQNYLLAFKKSKNKKPFFRIQDYYFLKRYMEG